jgi:hypothetical protein
MHNDAIGPNVEATQAVEGCLPLVAGACSSLVLCVEMGASTRHRHGTRVHAHPYRRTHRHFLSPSRSQPLDPHLEHDHDVAHGHSHGLVDRSIFRSRAGLRAVALSLFVLGLTAAAQAVMFVATGSVALLADLIHNVGDALRTRAGRRLESAALVADGNHARVRRGPTSPPERHVQSTRRSVLPERVTGLLPVAGAAVASGSFNPGRQRSRAGGVEGVEIDLGHAPIETDGLVGE